jgi:hypothetical protein
MLFYRTSETWGNPAKLFVHEWAKLRYGVFDEFGFSGLLGLKLS